MYKKKTFNVAVTSNPFRFLLVSLFKTTNKRLSLLLFFSTVVCAVTCIVQPDLEGVNFAKALFGKRLDKVFQESALDSETPCQIQCLKHNRCLSYNLGTSNEKGNFTCQLCDTDRFTSHQNLTHDEKWLYRGMEEINRRS